MSEGAGGGRGGWAAGGLAAGGLPGGLPTFPGFNPRPEHSIKDKKHVTENFNSTNKATFVHIKGCEGVTVNIEGKIGKLCMENNKNITINLSDNVVGGTLEVIKSSNVKVFCRGEAEVPIVQVDDSSCVEVTIEKKDQLECIVFIRSNDIKLFLDNQTVNDDQGLTLQYLVSAPGDELEDVQRCGHWTAASVDATFVTEKFVRTGKYPTVAQMKHAIAQNQAAQ